MSRVGVEYFWSEEIEDLNILRDFEHWGSGDEAMFDSVGS